MVIPVIPAKAGIQEKRAILDPGVRRGDAFGNYLRRRHSLGVSTFPVNLSSSKEEDHGS
jgi:hypothetical protein